MTERQAVAEAAQAIHKITCRAAELSAHCDGATSRDFELARDVAPHFAAAERERILAAARQAVVTFTRPGLGNGPEHGQHVKVVPWAVLAELLGEEKPQ